MKAIYPWHLTLSLLLRLLRGIPDRHLLLLHSSNIRTSGLGQKAYSQVEDESSREFVASCSMRAILAESILPRSGNTIRNWVMQEYKKKSYTWTRLLLEKLAHQYVSALIYSPHPTIPLMLMSFVTYLRAQIHYHPLPHTQKCSVVAAYPNFALYHPPTEKWTEPHKSSPANAA